MRDPVCALVGVEGDEREEGGGVLGGVGLVVHEEEVNIADCITN